MISVIIPSRNEPYLNKTLDDLLKKAEGDIEVFVNIDGDKPDDLVKDDRITYFHNQKSLGMRGGINLGLKHAKGKYIMKVDAHCLFDKGFDKVLVKMEDDWLVTPRRYSLHGDWRREMRMPYKDYHYLSFPSDSRFYGFAMFPLAWPERTKERVDIDIDDTMTLQGSLWLANRDYFMKHVGFLNDSDDAYTTFSGEQLEIGLKYWLGGGKVKINKNTWYAHLFKNSRYYRDVANKNDRKYKVDLKAKAGWEWAADHWINDREPNMKYKFEWLLEKFWPVPGWPGDRRKWKAILK